MLPVNDKLALEGCIAWESLKVRYPPARSRLTWGHDEIWGAYSSKISGSPAMWYIHHFWLIDPVPTAITMPKRKTRFLSVTLIMAIPKSLTLLLRCHHLESSDLLLLLVMPARWQQITVSFPWIPILVCITYSCSACSAKEDITSLFENKTMSMHDVARSNSCQLTLPFYSNLWKVHCSSFSKGADLEGLYDLTVLIAACLYISKPSKANL